MSGETRGYDVLLKVNTGTVGSPTWTIVGSKRNVTFDETMTPVDVSSNDSLDDAFLGGRRNYKITLDAVYAPSNTAQAALKNAHRNSEAIQVCRSEDGVNIEKIMALITSINRTAPHEAESVLSVGLQLTGSWAAA